MGTSILEKSGDFARIIGAHDAYVRGVLRRRGVRGADVDDLTQGVFLVAYERIDELPRTSSMLRKWLAGVAFRFAQNWRRSRWIRCVEFVDLSEFETMPGSTGADMELRAIISDWLEGLPCPRRDVARLRLRGLGFTAIASRLRMRRSTAFTHWQKAQASFHKGGDR